MIATLKLLTAGKLNDCAWKLITAKIAGNRHGPVGETHELACKLIEIASKDVDHQCMPGTAS